MAGSGSFYTPTSGNYYGGGNKYSSAGASVGKGSTSRGGFGMGLGNAPKPPTFPTFPDIFGGGQQQQGGVQQGWYGQRQPGTSPAAPVPPGGPYSFNPPPMTSQAQRDPYLMQIFQANEAYRKQLASNTDQDAILAQQRQRDVSSGIMNELSENAAQRGLGPESGASQWMQMRGADAARRDQAGLNATMASQGRNMQMGALGQSGQLAGGMAGNLLGQQNYALDQWRAQQAAAQAQAQLQLSAQNSAYQNMAQMAQLQMQALNAMSNFYSGF